MANQILLMVHPNRLANEGIKVPAYGDYPKYFKALTEAATLEGSLQNHKGAFLAKTR